MQKWKKIKFFYTIIHLFLILNVILFITILIYIYQFYYNKEPIAYDFSAFEVPGLHEKGKNDAKLVDENELNIDNKKIVASKNGTKYYYLKCSGVNRIKNENKVYFDTFQDAEREGLELAKNCQKP